MSEDGNTFYFFRFEDIQTQEVYTNYVERKNPTSTRYGEFDIIIPTDFGLSSGYFEYKVFSNDNDTDTDTDLMQLLEIGMAQVLLVDDENKFYDNPTLTGVAYGRS